MVVKQNIKQVVTQRPGVKQVVTQKLGLVEQEVNQIGTQKPGVALRISRWNIMKPALASGQCASCLRYVQYHILQTNFPKKYFFNVEDGLQEHQKKAKTSGNIKVLAGSCS